jgi:hypothetical protein
MATVVSNIMSDEAYLPFPQSFITCNRSMNSTMSYSDAAGLFAQLADPMQFANVFVDHAVVTWPGEIDLAPDAMLAAIKQAGTCELA